MTFMRKTMASPTNHALHVHYRQPYLHVVAKRQLGIRLADRPRQKNWNHEEVMRKQNYIDRAKLNPARTFTSPMEVVEANDITTAEKLIILKSWEADERALLRAEDEGMAGGEHTHLHKVQAALNHLTQEL
jgi:hypothetical protein